jgi:stress response protein YsnF
MAEEEVVISKHSTETEETVETDLREEKIDVDRQGDVSGRNRDRSRGR